MACFYDRRTVARCPAPCIAAPGSSARTRAVVAVSPAATATYSLTACSFLSVSYNTQSKKHTLHQSRFLWIDIPHDHILGHVYVIILCVPGGVFKTAFQRFALSVSNGELVSNGLQLRDHLCALSLALFHVFAQHLSTAACSG